MISSSQFSEKGTAQRLLLAGSYSEYGLGVVKVGLTLEPLKCIGCARCEIACGFVRDGAFTSTSASIMLYRAEEKNNYFGLLYKTKTTLVSGRPEGVEESILGVVKPGEGAGGKPILLRPSCQNCMRSLCVEICPTSALSVKKEAV